MTKNSMKFKQMEVTVEKIVYPGKSLARGKDGIAVFVDNGLPGELLEIAITKDKKTFREGIMGLVKEKAKNRISPLCSSFGICGGCSFQHMNYQDQLETKQKYVTELLSKFGVKISPIVRSPEEWGYRNKMELSFFEDNNGLNIGLHRKGQFNRYFGVPPCYIADKDFLEITERVIEFARKSKLKKYDNRKHDGFYRHLVLRKGKKTNEILINLVTARKENIDSSYFNDLVSSLKGKVTSINWTVNSSPSDVVKVEELKLLHGKEMIEEKLCIRNKSYTFSISPVSFFQTNTLCTELLYENVLDCFDPQRNDFLIDLYCGTGTIGMVLAPYVNKILGVEQVKDAIENAELNAKKNNIKNITFKQCSVEKWIKSGQIPESNSLIIDPPRAGISNAVIRFIRETMPEKIVYVSCNPATLARDLAIISSELKYKIDKIIPVDMFPQTYHVETVVSLKK